MAIEREELERLAKDRDDEMAILDRNIYGRLKDLLDGKEVRQADRRACAKGSIVKPEALDDLPRNQWWEVALTDEEPCAYRGAAQAV